MSTKKLDIAVVVTPEPDQFALSIPSKVELIKRELLERITPITQITTQEEQDQAQPVVSDVKAVIRDVEKLCLDVRRKFEAVQKDVLSQERSITDPLKSEAKRVEGLLSSFQERQRIAAERARQEEERKRQEALREEQRRQDELARLERERIEADQRAERERLAREQEAQRQKEELERLERERQQAEINSKNAKDQAERDRIAAEQARIEREAAEAEARAANARREEAERLEREANERRAREEKEFEAAMALQEAADNTTEVCSAPVPEVQTGVKNGRVGQKPDITLLDIHALYKAYPQCVKMEMKVQAVKDLASAGITEIPGVSIIWRTAVSVNASRRSAITATQAEELPFD